MSKVLNDKQLRAAKLLALGMSQSESAREIAVSRQVLNSWLKKSIFQDEIARLKKELFKESPQEKESIAVSHFIQSPTIRISEKSLLRERELDLLQNIEELILPQLQEGSIKAAMLLLKLSERRSKLLGLDQRSYEVLEATHFLVDEGVIPEAQLEKLTRGLNQLQIDLKAN